MVGYGIVSLGFSGRRNILPTDIEESGYWGFRSSFGMPILPHGVNAGTASGCIQSKEKDLSCGIAGWLKMTPKECSIWGG